MTQNTPDSDAPAEGWPTIPASEQPAGEQTEPTPVPVEHTGDAEGEQPAVDAEGEEFIPAPEGEQGNGEYGPVPDDNDQADQPQHPDNVGDDADVDADGNEPGYVPPAES